MYINKKRFFEEFRPYFKRITGKNLTKAVVQSVDFLLDKFSSSSRWNKTSLVAYSLSTILHETAFTFKPIKEYGSKSYFNKYNVGTKIGKNLGNTEIGDGYKYLGRGYVQITGRRNYTKFGIQDNPDMALDPDTAFRIMTEGMFQGIFTGKKITDYITSSRKDYVNARRVINGLDKATKLAQYAVDFENILNNSIQSTPYIEEPVVEGKSLELANTELPTVIDSVTTVPAPPEKIAIVAAKPPGVLSKIYTKVAAALTGNVIVTTIVNNIQSMTGIAVDPMIVAIVLGTAVAFTLIWIGYEIYKREKQKRIDRELDEILVKANTTDTNTVQIIPEDSVALFRAKNYKIITRGKSVHGYTDEEIPVNDNTSTEVNFRG